MRFLRRVLVSLAALTLAVVSNPAYAAQSQSVTQPGAQLTLSVTDETGFTYSTDLQCMPEGGDHSDQWMACHRLKEAKGDFSKLKESEEAQCTRDHKPVVLAASGYWRGQDVEWEKEFSNECVAHQKTSQIFDF